MVLTWVIEAVTWVVIVLNIRMNINTRKRIVQQTAEMRVWSEATLNDLRANCEHYDRKDWRYPGDRDRQRDIDLEKERLRHERTE